MHKKGQFSFAREIEELGKNVERYNWEQPFCSLNSNHCSDFGNEHGWSSWYREVSFVEELGSKLGPHVTSNGGLG